MQDAVSDMGLWVELGPGRDRDVMRSVPWWRHEDVVIDALDGKRAVDALVTARASGRAAKSASYHCILARALVGMFEVLGEPYRGRMVMGRMQEAFRQVARAVIAAEPLVRCALERGYEAGEERRVRAARVAEAERVVVELAGERQVRGWLVWRRGGWREVGEGEARLARLRREAVREVV